MNKSILFNCTVKIENVWFHISVDKSFFESVAHSVSLHNHADYEVHIIETGDFAFQIDGQELVLHSGNCLLIGPKVYHSKGNALSPTARRHSLKFEYYANSGETSEVRECVEKMKSVCLLENGEKEISLVESLIAEFQTRQTGYKTGIDNLFSLLLLTLLRDISGHQPSAGADQLTSTEENRSVDIDEFFAKNYRCNVHAAELASLLCLSVRQLNRIMLKSYGVPFKQKLSQMRIIAAKELLFESNLTVSRIAEATGYGNAGNFGSTFKKLTGMTPEQYRKTISKRCD